MSTTGIIITIDGTAGSGKSTVAKKLAQNLSVDYLDTGGMYRAVALLGLIHCVNWENPDELSKLVQSHRIEAHTNQTLLDGHDVTEVVRSAEVTAHTRYAADNPIIRDIMVKLQRQMANGRSLVTEGRDQGSIVFPNAFCKFFLTAEPLVRAKRRVAEMSARGEMVDIDTVLAGIIARDRQDRERSVGPLIEPDDAVIIDSSQMTPDEIVQTMENEVLHHSRIANEKNQDIMNESSVEGKMLIDDCSPL